MIPFSFWHRLAEMRTVEASGLVHGGHPYTHLSQQLLLRTYRYHFQLPALIPLWLFLSSSTFVQILFCSLFPLFLSSSVLSFLSLLLFYPFSIILLFFNPVTLKSYKHLHDISPYNITPKSKYLKKWSATRCEGAFAG